MKASFTSRSGFPFQPNTFVVGCMESGICTRSQANPLVADLKQYDVDSLTVERICGNLWVTLITPRGSVITWRIGQRGKVTFLNTTVGGAE